MPTNRADAASVGVLANLDGWSVSICPGCGATVGEWLTEDGPDVVEYDECPMCQEAAAEEEWWF